MWSLAFSLTSVRWTLLRAPTQNRCLAFCCRRYKTFLSTLVTILLFYALGKHFQPILIQIRSDIQPVNVLILPKLLDPGWNLLSATNALAYSVDEKSVMTLDHFRPAKYLQIRLVSNTFHGFFSKAVFRLAKFTVKISGITTYSYLPWPPWVKDEESYVSLATQGDQGPMLYNFFCPWFKDFHAKLVLFSLDWKCLPMTNALAYYENP